MKKIFIIGITIMCIIFTGCKGSKDLIEINYNELAKKIQNEESFVLYVGASDCSHCAEFRPTLEKIIYENNLDVYYINIANLTNSKRKAVLDKVDTEGTPTTVYIKKGKTLDEPRIKGALGEDETLDFFKEIGYMKGE